MTKNAELAELRRRGALAFAKSRGATRAAAEEFAFEYMAVLEDRAHERRYPDVPLPTPEEVWIS